MVLIRFSKSLDARASISRALRAGAVRTALAALGLAVGPGTAGADTAFRGALQWYIADLKTSFPEHPMHTNLSALTEANFEAVLDGLKTRARFNGVRLPIFPATARAVDYPPLYRKILAEARRLGLAVYASPMSVGMSDYEGWSDARYAQWLADYAREFHPDFLSPFNEPGISTEREGAIVSLLRPLLEARTLLVGPGRQHVAATLKEVRENPSVARMFDIVDSHNANRDRSATFANWRRLVESGGRPVWASENPGVWTPQPDRGLPGVQEAIEAGVTGLVIWTAKPAIVDDEGRLTERGREFANRLAP